MLDVMRIAHMHAVYMLKDHSMGHRTSHATHSHIPLRHQLFRYHNAVASKPTNQNIFKIKNGYK